MWKCELWVASWGYLEGKLFFSRPHLNTLNPQSTPNNPLKFQLLSVLQRDCIVPCYIRSRYSEIFSFFQRFIDAHPGIPILDNLTHIVPLHDRTSMFQQLQKFESVKNGKTKWDSISLELTAVYLCHPISHICQGFLTNSLALGKIDRYQNTANRNREHNRDDVIKWKHFPCYPGYWPFVRGIHRSPVNSPHKGQWRGALIFSLICVWINDWVKIVRLVIRDAIAPIMTSFWCLGMNRIYEDRCARSRYQGQGKVITSHNFCSM